jgi:uncharacterized protein (DUF1800 family)
MGQALFDPPDVGGWPINSAWISSSSMLARVNFVSALLEATPALPDASAAVAAYLDGVVSPQTAKQIQSAGSAHDAWFAVLASPEFQLK